MVYTCSPSWTPLPYPSPYHSLGHPSAPVPSILYHASNLDWRFISYMILYMLSFKPAFWLSSFTFIKKLFGSSSLSAIRVVSATCLRLLIFLPAILIPACASLKWDCFWRLYQKQVGGSLLCWATPWKTDYVIFFLAALGLYCCPLALASCGMQLLIAVASPIAEHRL